MSKFSISQIQKLAKLAKIKINDDQAEKFSSELENILDFIDELQSADLGDLEPTSQVTGLVDSWRDDVVEDCDIPREELLKNAPDTQDGYIKVRRII